MKASTHSRSGILGGPRYPGPEYVKGFCGECPCHLRAELDRLVVCCGWPQPGSWVSSWTTPLIGVWKSLRQRVFLSLLGYAAIQLSIRGIESDIKTPSPEFENKLGQGSLLHLFFNETQVKCWKKIWVVYIQNKQPWHRSGQLQVANSEKRVYEKKVRSNLSLHNLVASINNHS